MIQPSVHKRDIGIEPHGCGWESKKGPGPVGPDPTSILTSSAGFPLGHPERDKIDK